MNAILAYQALGWRGRPHFATAPLCVSELADSDPHEMHDKKNISRLKDLNANIIGVNCRNLKTMETDLSLFGKLANDLPSNSIKVAESGIKTSDDIKYVYGLGYDAILIGTSLMRSGSPGNSLERLISSL